MNILTKIKKYFLKTESRQNLNLILGELKKLDHSKWKHPQIKHKECRGYGHIGKGPEELVDDLFHRVHPDYKFVFFDGPFNAYPENDPRVEKLNEKDLYKLLIKFRKLTYPDRKSFIV